MKKIYILAAVALVASAACTKIETPDTPETSPKIAFEVASFAKQTKADANSTSLASEGFYSFKTTATFFPAVGGAQTFMDNVSIFAWNNNNAPDKVTSGNDIYSWAPEYDYYWPKTGYINFFSYAGSKTPDVTVASDKKTVTFAYANAEIGADDNILVAKSAMHFNANAQTYQHDHVTEGVPTLFEHMLAKVAFKFHLKTTDAKISNNTEWTVTILNQTGKQSAVTPIKTGSLTLQDVDALAVDATKNTTTRSMVPVVGSSANVSGWIPGTATETIYTPTTEPVLTIQPGNTESAETKPLIDMRSVLPQAVTGVNVHLYYKISAKHTGEANPFMEEIIEVNSALSALVNTPASWEKNHRITYTINIDPVSQKVTFDPAVEKWDDTYNDGTDDPHADLPQTI